MAKNEGFVNVGISADTSEFAVNSIRLWWNTIGRFKYPDSKKLLICADCGGSNGNRSRAMNSSISLHELKLQAYAFISLLFVDLSYALLNLSQTRAPE